MNWYKGDIAEAVTASKMKNAIFVVYVAGQDDNSAKLTKFLDDENVRSEIESDKFIAIRIESGTEAYTQFAKIYQMVPVPSIFFIGKSGAPLEIGTSLLKSSDELMKIIDSVLEKSGKAAKSATPSSSAAAAASNALINAEKSAQQIADKANDVKQPEKQDDRVNEEAGVESSDGKARQKDEVICEDGVCRRKPLSEEADGAEASTSGTIANNDCTESNSNNSEDFNVRLEQTRKLLEQKRHERIEEERRLEKERELQRRRDGKELQHLQEWQREQELKELKANMRRERMEADAARQRILAQIAADRAERAQKFGSNNTNDTSPAVAGGVQQQPQQQQQQFQQAADIDGQTRIQFRFANGDTNVHNFENQSILADIRTYVRTELLSNTGIREFMLATNYPKRDFSSEDDQKSLVELNLTPSAVIFVITKSLGSSPKSAIQRNGGMFNIISAMFWTVLTPIFSAFGYLRNMVSGGLNFGTRTTNAQKRTSEETDERHDAAKRRNLSRLATGGVVSDSGATTSAAAAAAAAAEEHSSDSKPYRRYGASNVHRLSDNHRDSDDENATWNGNSTQQQ